MEASPEVPLETALVRPGPRPRPLALVLLVTAFLGGSCTVQKMTLPGREAPTAAELDANLLPALQDESGKMPPQVAAAMTGYLEAQVRVAKRFSGFVGFVGFFLVAAYTFLTVYALRAFLLAPDAPRRLSLVALIALPFRAAMAALDLAAGNALEPQMTALAQAMLASAPSGSEADRLAAAAAVARLSAAFPVVAAVLVCALLTWAWRYFQRPEVVQFYENRLQPGS